MLYYLSLDYYCNYYHIRLLINFFTQLDQLFSSLRSEGVFEKVLDIDVDCSDRDRMARIKQSMTDLQKMKRYNCTSDYQNIKLSNYCIILLMFILSI
jgi:hypothetical protein